MKFLSFNRYIVTIVDLVLVEMELRNTAMRLFSLDARRLLNTNTAKICRIGATALLFGAMHLTNDHGAARLQAIYATLMGVPLETISELSFCRFSGSFEPLFDSFFGVNIKLRIWTPKKESKIGQKNPENRRSLNSETVS